MRGKVSDLKSQEFWVSIPTLENMGMDWDLGSTPALLTNQILH